MSGDYGYIKKTAGAGADREHLDATLSPNPSETSPVFIVDQNNLDGTFNELKTFLGYQNQAEALNAYRRSFSDGSADKRNGGISQLTIDQFKDFLKSGDLSKPVSGQLPKPDKIVNAETSVKKTRKPRVKKTKAE